MLGKVYAGTAGGIQKVPNGKARLEDLRGCCISRENVFFFPVHERSSVGPIYSSLLCSLSLSGASSPSAFQRRSLTTGLFTILCIDCEGWRSSSCRIASPGGTSRVHRYHGPRPKHCHCDPSTLLLIFLTFSCS